MEGSKRKRGNGGSERERRGGEEEKGRRKKGKEKRDTIEGGVTTSKSRLMVIPLDFGLPGV